MILFSLCFLFLRLFLFFILWKFQCINSKLFRVNAGDFYSHVQGVTIEERVCDRIPRANLVKDIIQLLRKLCIFSESWVVVFLLTITIVFERNFVIVFKILKHRRFVSPKSTFAWHVEQLCRNVLWWLFRKRLIYIVK